MRGIKTEYIIYEGKKYAVCNTCGELLEEKEFYKDEHCTLGIRPKCKKCTKEYYKQNRITRLSYQNKYNEKKLGTRHKSDDSYNVFTKEEKMKIEAYELLYPRKI